MKNLYSIFLLGLSLRLHGSDTIPSINSKYLSFYQVNLVCGAASEIGCGSRSKPILIELKSQTDIAQTWLNRPGTIIAVQNKESADIEPKQIMQLIKKHGFSATLLKTNDRKKQLESFQKDRWYLATEVDELSIEEAGIIAESVMEELMKKGIIAPEKAQDMKMQVESFIRDELLNLEDVKLLDQSSYYKEWEKGIKKIASFYTTEDKVDQIKLFALSPWIKYSAYIGGVLVFALGVYLFLRWQKD